MRHSLRPRFAAIPLAAMLLAFQGCTTSEAGYESFKRSSEHYCRTQPPSESQHCLDGLNKKSYSEYQKERAAQKQ